MRACVCARVCFNISHFSSALKCITSDTIPLPFFYLMTKLLTKYIKKIEFANCQSFDGHRLSINVYPVRHIFFIINSYNQVLSLNLIVVF